MVVSHSIELFA